MRTLLIIVAASTALLCGLSACKIPDPPPIEGVWEDKFERSSIGKNYLPTRHLYKIKDGVLRIKGAENHPLWLRKKLPRNVRIEFSVKSDSRSGDIKVELFGDGKSHAPNRGAYTSTGYVILAGGWSNKKSLIARRNEHGREMVADTKMRVTPGKWYQWKIERKGAAVTWWIDGKQFLHYVDPRPMEGPGHQYFGFDNWRSDCSFDNLKITPL